LRVEKFKEPQSVRPEELLLVELEVLLVLDSDTSTDRTNKPVARYKKSRLRFEEVPFDDDAVLRPVR
jgi:hypothetical protein